MNGSLALQNGVLYVGRFAKTASLRTYDLDGHPLAAGFDFGPVRGARQASVTGLALDGEHTLWIADPAGFSLRRFNLFGAEQDSLHAPSEEDEAGCFGRVVDVLVTPEEYSAQPTLLVATRGQRRHALHLLLTDGTFVQSLRPLGDPRGHFDDLRRVSMRTYEREGRIGLETITCEAHGGRLQVFRDGDYHYCPEVLLGDGRAFQPAAVAALGDGRILTAQGGEEGALLLLDASGKILSVLAGGGREGGQMSCVEDLVVAEGPDDRHTRVVVMDCDGDRVQVFNLEGRCYGSFQDLPWATS